MVTNLHLQTRRVVVAAEPDSPDQKNMTGDTASPDRPEKIELVRDGTSSTPTVNVTKIIQAWTEYKSCSSSPRPGGSVVKKPVRKRSKTKMNALAMTNMNEYWMNALSQPQKSHSSWGTMKNGTKSGPTKAQMALAIMLNETTNTARTAPGR